MDNYSIMSFHQVAVQCNAAVAGHDIVLAAATSLEISSQFGIPDDFVLVTGGHVQNRCHIIWRKKNRIEVAFK
jgi:hypothetical protein